MTKKTNAGEKGNVNLFFMVAVSVALVLVAVLMTAILYSSKIQKNKNEVPAEKKFAGPQEIVDYSIGKTLDLKTYSVAGNLKLDMKIESTEKPNPSVFMLTPSYGVIYDVKIKEKIDQSDPDNEKVSGNIGLDISMSSEGGSEDYSVNFDAMLIGKDFAYLKLNDFDFGMMGFIIGAQAKQYKGKWYELNLEEMREKSEGDFSFDKFSSAEMKKILNKNKIIKFAEDMGDDKIGGVNAYHFRTKISTEGVIGYYKALLKLRDSEARGVDLKKITSTTAVAFDEFTEKQYDLINKTLGKMSIEIWIGKSDNLIHKMSISGDYDKEFIEKTLKKTVAEEQVKSRLNSKDSSIKYYMERVKKELDAYNLKNRSYENFKMSSSLGSSYSKSVEYNLNSNSYVIWSSLESTDDLWCIDSAGKSGYVTSGFTKWDCSGASSESKSGQKDMTKLVDEEVANMKVDMEFSLESNFVFGEFNVPLNIQKPEKVEDMTKVFNNI